MAESRIKDGNFIVIQSFMVKDLKLKGNELVTYAIIYGFSQDGENRFTGSLQYICDWTNSTKQGIMKTLKNLVEKGLVEKTEIYKNGVKFVEYHVTEFTTMQQSLTEDTTKFNGGGKQSLTGGMQQSLPNNISSNNIADNTDKKERKKESYDSIIAESNFNEDVKETIIEFVKMRKLIKKPMTDYALKKMLNKLGKLSNDPQTQIEILDKSINNNWQDIYEPKVEGKPAKQSGSMLDDMQRLYDKYAAEEDIEDAVN
jgi:hypothetical protein